ncbi:MAG TPA: hypothetical protein VHP83_16315 [Aggregatilineaceae bacterium]|nr:hypothetical protein [Aggregatilineaceae bacterium]
MNPVIACVLKETLWRQYPNVGGGMTFISFLVGVDGAGQRWLWRKHRVVFDNGLENVGEFEFERLGENRV